MFFFVPHPVLLRLFILLHWCDDTATTASHLDVIQGPPGLTRRSAGRERREVFGPLMVPPSRILNQRVRIAIFLHALGIVVQLPIHEPARLPQNVLVARQLVEALLVVAIAVQFDVLIVLILTTFRFDHLQHRWTAIHAGPVPYLLPEKRLVFARL